ncbi:MAG: magnesium chelatase [Parcubacteria group bacterium CG11_big_fil_rev_8_21_14_0_20_39_22]|nr:MAG: magnesium chelatase [Parcubacteria group bacterium CG11_big_fil_rev_8_21_14_0_20_39_22]
MSFARVYSAQPSLLGSHIITVETDITKGLNSFSVVGLADKAVEESRDRMAAAIKNCGLTSPKQQNKKTVIALAPADLKKEGPLFDVAMALSYLLAAEECDFDVEKRLFVGELSLNGNLRPVKGILPIVKEAKDKGFKEVYVPKDNAAEAGLIQGIDAFGVETLESLLEHLDKNTKKSILPTPKTKIVSKKSKIFTDMSEIKGQEGAKRGLEIAAAGGHNIAMWGPPGTGKTMLARAFIGLLPELSYEEILEVTSIHSVAGALSEPLMINAPFRSPHHSASSVAIVGGGTIPKPGEITLAHRGVLFLDEFPEFNRQVIETLRQPLEDKVISISRARGSINFPADFILVATMNPCPCGNYGNNDKVCICSPSAIVRYKRKISGPIMDRIDVWIEVPHVGYKMLETKEEGEHTEDIKKRVLSAREKQKLRLKSFDIPFSLNASLSGKSLKKVAELNNEVADRFRQHAEALSLSPRAYHKVIKLARTIADLDNQEEIKEKHILEAVGYRPKEEAL